MGSLQRELPTFTGTDQDFAEWATAIVTAGAIRHKFLALAMKEWKPLIYSAIQRGMSSEHNQAVDYSKDPEDLYWEIVLLIMNMAPDLAKAGTAKMTTRIFDLAKKHVRFHVVKLNRRHKLNRERVENQQSYRCETVSAEERDSELAVSNAERRGEN